MIATMIAAAMMGQASADLRSAYVTCLGEAVKSAKSASITADGFKDYARTNCAAAEGSFKAKLVSFNVKNGMAKKLAADDAEIQLDDYLYTAGERYRVSLQPPK